MTRVDFYLLTRPGPASKESFACKLTNKAFRLGHQIYVLTASAQHSRELDRFLWTFDAGSFIPHDVYSNNVNATLPVIIGHGEPPDTCHDILISLVTDVPQFFSRFDRVMDVVDSTEDDRTQARKRYRFYRERGYELETHEL